MKLIISPFSAIPSWEGFEYQGHIALYITVSSIWDLVRSGNINSINSYILSIEGAEDFSIIKDNCYLSMHQVKEGNFTIESNDMFSFIISLLQYNATKGYYHINPSVKLPVGFIETTLNTIDNLFIEFEKEVITKEEFAAIVTMKETKKKKKIPKNSSEYKSLASKYILINKITYNTEKGSHYKILNYVCKGNKSKTNVKDCISQVKMELSTYKSKLAGKSDFDYFEEFNDKFIDSNSVIKSTCSIIGEMLKVVNPGGQIYYNDLYFRFVYDQMLLKMKESIRLANTKQDKNSCIIAFKTMYEIIIFNHKENSNTVEYQYYELFKLIIDEFNNYPNTRRSLCSSENCNSCSDNNSCNLYSQIRLIECLDYEKIKDLLYKLLLRTPKNNIPQSQLIRNLLFVLIKKIDTLKYFNNNVFLAEKSDKFYRLTLDENEYFDDFLEQIQKESEIFNVDKFLIYESDVLITDRLNENKFRYNQIGFNVIGENEFKDISEISTDSFERQKINFTKSKIMRIISKDKAEEELCNNV